MTTFFEKPKTVVQKSPPIKIPKPAAIKIPSPRPIAAVPTAGTSTGMTRAQLLARRRRGGLSSLILTPLGMGGGEGPSTLGGGA